MAKREMYLKLKKSKLNSSVLDLISNESTLEAVVNKDFVKGLGQNAVYTLEDKGYVNITITMSSLQ